MKKLLYGTLVAVISFVLVGFGSPSAAFANGDVNTILANTNAARAANNLSPLTLNSAMSAVAQAWSEQQAAEANMYHNPNYSTQIPSGWKRAGENVAYGYSVSGVVDAWMNSSGHRANILGDFDNIGIGSYGSYYTQVFAKYGAGSQPLNPPAPPPAPPAPPTTPSNPPANPGTSSPPTTPTTPTQEPTVQAPGAPKVTTGEVSDTTLVIVVASGDGGAVETFEITLKQGEQVIDTKSLTEPGEITFDNLTEKTDYTIIVKASNSGGSAETIHYESTLPYPEENVVFTPDRPRDAPSSPPVPQDEVLETTSVDEGVPVLVWVAAGVGTLLLIASGALIYTLKRRSS